MGLLHKHNMTALYICGTIINRGGYHANEPVDDVDRGLFDHQNDIFENFKGAIQRFVEQTLADRAAKEIFQNIDRARIVAAVWTGNEKQCSGRTFVSLRTEPLQRS